MVSRPIVPLALIGMLTVSGLVLGRIYAGDLLPRLLLVAALGSVLIATLVRRLPGWSAAPISVVGLAALTVVAVRLSASSGGVPGALPDLVRDALRNGIPRLLTVLIPIEPQPDTVVVPVIATWLAGLAAAELALRYQRVLLSYTMPTLLLGGALYLVGPNARPTLWLPLAFAGFAALGLAASAREGGEAVLTKAQRMTLRVRLGIGAAAGLAIIIALGTAVGPSVAGRVDQTPIDPRRYVTPPQLDALDENPLVRLSGWALNRDQHLFDAKVTVSGGVPGGEVTRIRLAVVSDFDGVTWRVGATYRPAGRVLTGPPADAVADESSTVYTQNIDIDQLDGRLLPGAATPERIDGVRIAYDAATGTMALPEGLRAGLAYTVVSRAPKRPGNALSIAEVPTGDSVARYVALPGTVPTDIADLAEELGSGVASPYDRALAVEAFIKEHYTLVSDAPSGHSYPNLSYFLFGPRNAAGQRGTSEQFAAAFAVLARALGLPTRIAVGFAVKVGDNQVRGGDAVAWPQVLFNGLDWIDFDPLPDPGTQARPVEEDYRPKADPSDPPPQEVPPPSASASPRPSKSPEAAAPPDGTDPTRLVLAVTGGVAGAAVLAWIVTVPLLRRALRRRRLGATDPAGQITGAWLEVLDGLRMAGRPALPNLAATEVVGYAASAASARAHAANRRAVRPPAPPIDDLALFANTVAFGPAHAATAEQARRATAQAVAYVGELRARRPWWRRLLWTVDPRPLRWARRK
jgi:transglutaminase-like putative cysteine protease